MAGQKAAFCQFFSMTIDRRFYPNKDLNGKLLASLFGRQEVSV
jgi:hypothetical protein